MHRQTHTATRFHSDGHHFGHRSFAPGSRRCTAAATRTRDAGSAGGRPRRASWRLERAGRVPASADAAVPRRAARGRHRRRQAARGPRRERPREPVEHRLPPERRHARHRAPRPPAHRPQRRARPRADCRHTAGLGDGSGWTAGGSAAPAVREEQPALPDLLEAVREGGDDGAAAWQVRRQGADRSEGPVRRRQLQYGQSAFRLEAGVRPRRDALHDHRRAWRSRAFAEHEHPRRQDPEAQGRRHGSSGQPVRREAGAQAGDLQLRPSQSTGARLSPGYRRAVGDRTRPPGWRRAQQRPGRQELRLAGRVVRARVRAERRRSSASTRGKKGSRSRRCSGFRRSVRRD